MTDGWWKLILGVVIGILGAGGIWLASNPPRGNPVQLMPPPTPAPIQVYITGAVKVPGVYALPVNSRVQDAIQAAGGFTSDADEQETNLAAILEDGEKIRIPSLLPPQESDSIEDSNPIPTLLVNINTATQEELEKLPGIGPSIANNIITYRKTEGSFLSIEEVQKVSGVGPAVYEDIKDLITVGDIP